ncbi:MFS transporter [Paraburkholderia heleia]|uniref:hypothetical protein n=2 Tax=Paraburkholderia heleia TaxID=634127 RepID=UPI0005A933AB|nr:hypothetical protein [Paraburkholderia heleia]
MLTYHDRVNISFTKLGMQSDLGMSDAIYGMAAGVLLVGYVLFEIPSNILMMKIGAAWTLSQIMILWGLTASAMLFVHDKSRRVRARRSSPSGDLCC